MKSESPGSAHSDQPDKAKVIDLKLVGQSNKAVEHAHCGGGVCEVAWKPRSSVAGKSARPSKRAIK